MSKAKEEALSVGDVVQVGDDVHTFIYGKLGIVRETRIRYGAKHTVVVLIDGSSLELRPSEVRRIGRAAFVPAQGGGFTIH